MFRAFGISFAFASFALVGGALTQTSNGRLPVTVENFARAETDRYLTTNTGIAGGLGRFHHSREPTSIEDQAVIRMNRDTLYSFAVFDLAAGHLSFRCRMPASASCR